MSTKSLAQRLLEGFNEEKTPNRKMKYLNEDGLDDVGPSIKVHTKYKLRGDRSKAKSGDEFVVIERTTADGCLGTFQCVVVYYLTRDLINYEDLGAFTIEPKPGMIFRHTPCKHQQSWTGKWFAICKEFTGKTMSIQGLK